MSKKLGIQDVALAYIRICNAGISKGVAYASASETEDNRKNLKRDITEKVDSLLALLNNIDKETPEKK